MRLAVSRGVSRPHGHHPRPGVLVRTSTCYTGRLPGRGTACPGARLSLSAALAAGQCSRQDKAGAGIKARVLIGETWGGAQRTGFGDEAAADVVGRAWFSRQRPRGPPPGPRPCKKKKDCDVAPPVGGGVLSPKPFAPRLNFRSVALSVPPPRGGGEVIFFQSVHGPGKSVIRPLGGIPVHMQ